VIKCLILVPINSTYWWERW